MDRFRPKYVTFDCHGTLINFQMAEAARDLFGHLLDGPRMDEFIRNFQAYRLDEVLQDWKPYANSFTTHWSAPAAATTSHFVPKTLKRSTTASRPGDRIRTYPRAWPN
jgi:FMN phosphatase YigB (HAD superfamily)